MPKIKKDNRGGKRPGAGRPRKTIGKRELLKREIHAATALETCLQAGLPEEVLRGLAAERGTLDGLVTNPVNVIVELMNKGGPNDFVKLNAAKALLPYALESILGKSEAAENAIINVTVSQI